MLYRKIIRPIVAKLRPKQAQTLALRCLGMLKNFFLTKYLVKLLYKRRNSTLETTVMGIDFPNPIGLAAGFDTNAGFCDQIADLGFGFVEVGPITPEPEPAFSDIANKGLFATIDNLRDIRPKTIVVADITHNLKTAPEYLIKDYEKSFLLLYDFVDMFVIDTSIVHGYSRNPIEDPDTLSDVMDVLLERRIQMEKAKPILLKISPDIPADQLEPILRYSMASGVDGIVAGDVFRNNEKQFQKNLDLVRKINEFAKGRLDIIGCGGILTPQDAAQMLDAGAQLVELYTGIIYEGPVLVRRTLKYLTQTSK